MKKTTSLLAALATLLSIVFLLGCAGELVFVKDAKLYRVDDDGDNRDRINPNPPPMTQNFYHRPDVDHEGKRVAFTAGASDLYAVGSIWTMKLNGNAAKQINLTNSSSIMARWYPNDQRYMAYYGEDSNGDFGIARVRTDLSGPANGGKICDTNVWDWAGFDLNKPRNTPVQIIFSHRELDTSFRLYRRPVEIVPACTASLLPIDPFLLALPPGVDAKDLKEKLPVVSFNQSTLASAVEWPGVVGMRLRGIDQDGNIGLPVTFEFENLEMITGVSFAEKDLKIYLSAKADGGKDKLYVVTVKTILEGISNLLSVTPPQIQSTIKISPDEIGVGSGKNVWPSGINDP